MPHCTSQNCVELTAKQLNFLGLKLGCFSGKPILDVSSGNDGWAFTTRQRCKAVSAIVDRAESAGIEGIATGSPAASISYQVHSLRRILIRDHSLFDNYDVTTETTIAVANLLSCLMPRGRVVIPISDVERDHRLWSQRFNGFPGTLRQREFKTGLLDYFSLAFLLRGIHTIPALEFTIGRKPLSRLQWHRLAREVVLNRSESSNAAA